MSVVHERPYYTVSEAARLLQISPSTVWRWIDAGKLPAYRIGGRAIRIKREDLDTFIRPVKEKDPGMDKELVIKRPVSAKELARRKQLAERVLALRERANIAPLTTANLIREVREEREMNESGC
jgi:excisionase family DNA binding protein